MKKIRIWLDDWRNPEDPWIQDNYYAEPGMVWCKTIGEVQVYLDKGNVEFVSFDNDLGQDKTGAWNFEGRKLAARIERLAATGRLKRIAWRVHTDNWVAHKEITTAMQNADKFWTEQENVSNI